MTESHAVSGRSLEIDVWWGRAWGRTVQRHAIIVGVLVVVLAEMEGVAARHEHAARRRAAETQRQVESGSGGNNSKGKRDGCCCREGFGTSTHYLNTYHWSSSTPPLTSSSRCGVSVRLFAQPTSLCPRSLRPRAEAAQGQGRARPAGRTRTAAVAKLRRRYRLR